MGKLCLLLASQSPRRRELLGLLGLPFQVAVPNIAEERDPSETPSQLVARLSQLKAHQVAVSLDGTKPDGNQTLVVAFDTIVLLDGSVLGKPLSAREAAETLRLLRGRPHTVYTAVTVLTGMDTAAINDVASTTVVMRDYSDDQIAAYVASGDPMDKAGAYAIQNTSFHPVDSWDGCYANVVGLPLCHLARCLEKTGHSVPIDLPAVCQRHFGQRCGVYSKIWNGRHAE